MTRGVGRWSWTREKRKRPLSSDRHKTDQQSGALWHAAGLAYDPRSWPLELDKKSGNGRSAPTGKMWLKGSLSHIFATKHEVLQEQ